MLTAAQIEARKNKLTASRVAALMTGDTVKIMDLYREMIGDPTWVEEDLSGIWAVQLGSATEALNAAWFDRKHGPISRCGEVVVHPNGWAACTLDLWSDLHGCAGECKHTGGHEPFETIVERYQPQLHHIMNVTNTKQCALSVIMGAREPIVEFIDYDAAYGAELWRRAEAFMQCVWSKTPPVDVDEPVVPPVPGKVYDLSTSNEWGSKAYLWRENIAAKKLAEMAEKELKAMVPADAKKAFGAGIYISRDRAGRLSLREEEIA
jgi:hypothetical protein